MASFSLVGIAFSSCSRMSAPSILKRNALLHLCLQGADEPLRGRLVVAASAERVVPLRVRETGQAPAHPAHVRGRDVLDVGAVLEDFVRELHVTLLVDALDER